MLDSEGLLVVVWGSSWRAIAEGGVIVPLASSGVQEELRRSVWSSNAKFIIPETQICCGSSLRVPFSDRCLFVLL
jgi:hypothetical protein